MIDSIVSAIKSNCVIISRHAREEAENDNLLIDEINFSVTQGEILIYGLIGV